MATQAGTKQARGADQKQGGQKSMGMKQQSRSANFPLDDLSYDMVTILYEKSKALEAFSKYIKDAAEDEEAAELFEQMRQADEQFIEQLRDQLGERFTQQ